MYQLRDDPIIESAEKTGYPYWDNDDDVNNDDEIFASYEVD